MTDPDPIENRLDTIERHLSDAARLIVQTSALARGNAEQIAELTADIRRLFDSASDHVRHHPGPTHEAEQ